MCELKRGWYELVRARVRVPLGELMLAVDVWIAPSVCEPILCTDESFAL